MQKSLKTFKKVTNLLQNLAKNGFFKFAPKRWTIVLFPYFHKPTVKPWILLLVFNNSTLNSSENKKNFDAIYSEVIFLTILFISL